MNKKIVLYSLKINEILLNLSIIFGIWVIGIVIHDIIIFATGETEAFPLGTIMTLMGILFLGIFANWSNMVQNFNLVVSMGSTRKDFIIQYSVQYFIAMIINVVFIRLLNLYEEARVGWFFKNCYLDFSVSKLFHPIIFILVPFVMLGVGILMGSLGIKFGANSRYVMLILWFVLIISFSKIGNGDILVKLFSLPGYVYGILLSVISIVFLLIGVLFIKDQQVSV